MVLTIRAMASGDSKVISKGNFPFHWFFPHVNIADKFPPTGLSAASGRMAKYRISRRRIP